MKKEESRFGQSNIMEGMISFRAVIRGIESGISDRKIEKVMFDTTRKKKPQRPPFLYPRHVSKIQF